MSHSGPHGGSSCSGTIAVVLSRAVLEDCKASSFKEEEVVHFFNRKKF